MAILVFTLIFWIALFAFVAYVDGFRAASVVTGAVIAISFLCGFHLVVIEALQL